MIGIMSRSSILRLSAAIGLVSSLASTGGCAWMVQAAAEAVADGEHVSGTAVADGEQVSGTAGAPAATADYQRSPVVAWGAFSLLQPRSVSTSLFDRASLKRPSPTCEPVPRGFLQLTGAPSGSPSEDLVALGPFRLGVAGLVVPIGSVLSTDREEITRRAFESGALLGLQGAVCSHSLFFHLTLGGKGESVLVHP